MADDLHPRPVVPSSPAKVAVGARIRALRTRHGISLRSLAHQLGISPGALSQIETGKAGLSATRLYQVVKILGTTFEDFFDETSGTAVAHHGAGPTAPRRRPDERSPTTSRPCALPPAPGPRSSSGQAGADRATSPAQHWRVFPPLRLDPVLTAALESFLELGYHGATVRNIARRCGLSVPGLYHYHASKQDMLAAILDITMADLLWRSSAARDEGGDPVQRFALLIECLALFHTYRRDLAFVGASEMRSLAPANRARIVGMRNEQQRMVDAEVEAAVATGQFMTPHPHEAARAVVTMCTALVQWYRFDGPLTPEQMAARYVEFALDLMRHRGPSGSGRT